MSTLVDLFGYLTVLVHALEMIGAAVLVGTVFCVQGVLLPESSSDRVLRRVRGILVAAAFTTAASTACAIALNAIVLHASLELAWTGIAGAAFVVSGAIEAFAAALLALIALRGIGSASRSITLVLAAVVLIAQVATSHAAARVDDRAAMLIATALHEAGAALWLGGLPALWAALSFDDPRTARAVGRRFSRVAMIGVALIVLGAAVFAVSYIGSPGAIYGTSYGVMAFAKTLLLALLLTLGASNFRTLRDADNDGHACARVRRVVHAEMLLGVAVLVAAASITSLPPASDFSERLAWRDIREAFRAPWPRLASPDHDSLALPALQQRLDREWAADPSRARPQAFVPGAGALPPRNASDVAWSEYNHHWAGVLVLAVGILALLHKTGHARWAGHWPLLFLVLAAFLLVRSDPEAWPLGDIGFLASLRDPEIVQHRAFVALIAAFSWFEWRVRLERVRSRHLARVFPAITAIGAVLLLGHSHALSSVREEVLIEISHVTIALLGIVAAAARWLELDRAEEDMRWPVGWIWPACFVAVGVVLLAYGEG